MCGGSCSRIAHVTGMPTATGSLDQGYAGDQLAAQQLGGGALVGQRSCLGVGDRDKSDHACLVLTQRQALSQTRSLYRTLLRLTFLVQHPQGREIVFHLLQATQHRLLVGCDGRIKRGIGLIGACAAGATIK